MLSFPYSVCRFFFISFLFSAVWLHNRIYLQVEPNIPAIILLSSCCTYYKPGMYLYRVRLPLLLPLFCVATSIFLLLLQQLLLFVIVCRMAKHVGSLNLTLSSVFFLFIQRRFIFKVCTPWQYCRISGLDLPIPSIIVGMRGAKAASARHGEAALVNICVDMLATSSQKSRNQIQTRLSAVNALSSR